MGAIFNILNANDVRLMTKYDTWAIQAKLAEKIDIALSAPQFIGSFADDTAANAVNHYGLSVGNFVPGDRYYDTTNTVFKTNTASAIGAATWTTE